MPQIHPVPAARAALLSARFRFSIFIEISKENLEVGDDGFVGQLQFSLCGTHDVAQNWAHEHATFLLSFGFQVRRASTCNFTHQARRVHMTVHGDDSIVVEREAMKREYEPKMEVPGPNAGQIEEVRVLNQIIRWTRTGLEYEPDQRHARKDHFRVGVGNVQVSVHTSSARKRLSNKNDDG